MPTLRGGVWGQHPTLHDFCSRLTAAGYKGRALEEAITKEYGIRVNADAVWKRLARTEKHGPTRELIEPREGFAESVRKEPQQHPTGWEQPRVQVDGDDGLI